MEFKKGAEIFWWGGRNQKPQKFLVPLYFERQRFREEGERERGREGEKGRRVEA